MHLPDGLLSVPVIAVASAASAGAVALSSQRLSNALGTRLAPLMGVTSAFVFAAQMLNFPVAAGTSGHFLGGVFAAVLLGPWAAIVVLTVVLSVQCLIFHDGGLLALGANVFNMGVVGAGGGYLLFTIVRHALGDRRGARAGAAVLAAWFATILAAIAASIELGLSGAFPFLPTLYTLVGIHCLIGVGEALITGSAIAALERTRPDIFSDPLTRTAPSAWIVVPAGLSIALVMAVFLSPWASSFPDGLEWALDQVSPPAKAQAAAQPEPVSNDSRQDAVPIPPTEALPSAEFPSLMPDYQAPGVDSLAIATGIAGLTGTLVVAVIAWGIGSLVARRDIVDG